MTETRRLHLPDGRQLAFSEYGDPAGRPVFYFHGTPGSRLEPRFSQEPALVYGFRVIALDRPGIGESDFQPGRTLLNWPDDVRQAADQLDVKRFGVIGVSGGGPYALASCLKLPEMVDFAALLGSWGPVAEDPSLWKEMAPLDRFFGQISKSAPWAFRLPFASLGFAARRLSPRGFLKSIESSMCPADRQLALDPEIARFFQEDIQEAFRQGVRGPADDAIILYSPWGFQVSDVQTRVNIFHGTEDKFAPINYARYLDRRLPSSRLVAYEGEGHLFVMRLFEDVFIRAAG